MVMDVSMLKIGIVGCGTIGSAVTRAIDEGRVPALLSGLASRTQPRAEELARSLRTPPPVMRLPALVLASDLVVEAATGAALEEIVPPACGRAGTSSSSVSADYWVARSGFARRRAGDVAS
jgi:predicted dinucleotide-utilizing enzyme